MAYVPQIPWHQVQPWSAPYFGYPAPQPPSVRSAGLPPQVVPAPTPWTRYKTAVPPAFMPAAFSAHSVRNGSGTKILM